MKLTISMPVHTDYSGMVFSTQALRIYQNLPVGTEILVLDNAPDTDDGRQTKKFIESFVPYGRYIPVTDRQSSFIKYDAFLHATGDVVLGIDSHVTLQPGAVKALLDWWEQHKGEPHNLTGPLIFDGLNGFSTSMQPVWRGSDYGIWHTDDEALKKGEPFEVPMQGMGMFSFWRDAFKPIKENFLHFGAEEFFCAERTRQAGGKTICHPAVGWWHRFNWPLQRPFPTGMREKVRNYYVAFLSLYGSLDHPKVQEMTEHWRKTVTEEELVWAISSALHSR